MFHELKQVYIERFAGKCVLSGEVIERVTRPRPQPNSRLLDSVLSPREYL